VISVPGKVQLIFDELPTDDYIAAIQGLAPQAAEDITVWLYSYVEAVESVL
jgi:hypothetical protein